MTFTMHVKYHGSPDQVSKYSSEELRDDFLTTGLMTPGKIDLHYTIFDRFVYGSIVPTADAIVLPTFDALKSEYFMERREMGVINTGGSGTIEADGETFELGKGEMLYLGKGTENIAFKSNDAGSPAMYYINSCPAHREYPNAKGGSGDANVVDLGDQEHANKRKIFQFIHEDGIQSCQLVMGYTELLPGNIWNTFPPHTHDRRMEVYFYFDLPEEDVVMHFMGQPQQTKSIVIRNNEAVVSPPWSIHAGAGSASYKFVWGMAGENKAFTDMDGVPLTDIL